MKALMGTVVVSALCATGAYAAEGTLMGTVSDSMCRASHGGMSPPMADRECTQACTAQGAQYVLISGGKVYKLAGHDADLKAHAGHVVNVTGEIKGDAVKVSKVAMPKND